jgi:hypothetical protein
VEVIAPFFIQLRSNKVSGVTSGAFQNTVTLYEKWATLRNKTALESDINALAIQMEALPTPSPISPIGTQMPTS